jgi:branched-chain amino acid aminotransferase
MSGEDDPIYNVDGELLPAGEATINVRDRGFRYGDAGFETIRAYSGELFEYEAHAERLRETCQRLAIPFPGSETLRDRIGETLSANDLEDAYVRASVTRGVQAGKLTPAPDPDTTVVVMVEPLPRGGVNGRPVWDGPAAVQTVKTRATPDRSVPSNLKTHNYLDGILARLELADGVDEALVRDYRGDVAEGATSNVFFVDDEGLHTPTADGPLLDGITRQVVLELADDSDVPVQTGRYGPDRFREAEEVFLTNTTWELRPVATVDGIEVGGGPVTDLLARTFDALVERRHYEG